MTSPLLPEQCHWVPTDQRPYDRKERELLRMLANAHRALDRAAEVPCFPAGDAA